MNLEDIQTQKSYIYLKEVENVAQDLLTLKDMKLDLCNAQNKYREALRAVEKAEERSVWLKEGMVYIQRPRGECLEILGKEMEKCKNDVDGIHICIKEKLTELRDLEHEPRIEGFSLKPLSVVEAKTLHKAFGST